MQGTNAGLMAALAIKVFGERNTGTRAVLKMIDAAPDLAEAGHPGVAEADLAAFDTRIAEVGTVVKGAWRRVYREALKDARAAAAGPVGQWKHAAPMFHPDFARHNVGVLFLTRNPYSWIVALHHRPYHNLGRRRGGLEAFVSLPWLPVGRDQVDGVLASPVDLWVQKMAAYGRFRADAAEAGVPTTVLRFEDFVQHPAAAMGRALRRLGVRCAGLKPVAGTKPGGRGGRARRLYYLNEAWRDHLTAGTVAALNTRLDWAVAEAAGYSRLDPVDFPVSDGKRRAAAAA